MKLNFNFIIDRGAPPSGGGPLGRGSLYLSRSSRADASLGASNDGSLPSALRVGILIALFGVSLSAPSPAQERPYFIAYNHQLEEPDHLELAFNPLFGTQREGNSFVSSWAELEYGVTGYWTTEVYLDGQATSNETALLTGFRWENRFRPLLHEHAVNPVLYVEYEEISAADKTLLEVVGFDGQANHSVPNPVARKEREHALEGKLILSSNFHGWNASGNFIAEKNLSGNPWEFGYALGASRPLGLAALPQSCRFCPELFTAGWEIYGGLGTAQSLTLKGTSHYLAPFLAWQLPAGIALRISPGWGLTGTSHHFLFRFGLSYEISNLRRRFRGSSP
jgi:hypothetical protein